jgi:hypothetical protein
MSICRRHGAGAGAGEAVSGPVPEPAPFSSFPAVLEFLTLLTWPDGTSRSSGTILTFHEQGCWKLCLNDRDAEESCFVSGRTLLEAFRQAEEAICLGTGDWRSRKGKTKGRG